MAESLKPRSLAHWLLFGLIVFAAAAAGMYVGGVFRQQQGTETAEVEADVFQSLTLKPGATFPDVELETTSYGRVNSRSILHHEGTVVLFLEADCSPCHSLSIDWQRAIDEGVITRDQVVGISYSDVNHVIEALANYHVDFPMYADPNYTFMDQYGVDGFPLILVVGKSGTIRYSDIDARKKVSPGDLREFLSQ